jgi:hypothetical protein
MYLQKTKIAEISAGKIDLELQVRVINLWTTPDRNNPAEDGAIHMIFLDQDVSYFFYHYLFESFLFWA